MMIPHWVFRLITLLIVFDLLNAFSAITKSKSPFFQTVTGWLDEENIAWQILEEKRELFHRDIATSHPILEVMASSTLYYLHILKSPQSMRDSLEPMCTRDMTNYIQYLNTRKEKDTAKISIIHLHEDVWHSQTNIVKSRLLTRLGGTSISISRVYGRKTKARRIDAGTAIPFLKKHHLWSATKARYYYGLFLPSKSNDKEDDVLVAVATFSTKRKITRGTRVTRSHELIRFCSRANGVVVGGITKLIRAFIKDQKPVDDIVTVIDRDWGPGDGWHAIGFETLHVSAPLLMVVKDGVRLHLVGAGIKNNNIQPGSKKGDDVSTGRLGVASHVLEELAGLGTHHDALHCLEKHKCYPVYDAGVERLVMAVPKAQGAVASSEEESSANRELRAEFIPSTYAATYRSTNSGIAAILCHAMAQTAASLYGRHLSEILSGKVVANDSMTAKTDAAAWKATGGNGKSETLLYKAPSSLDPSASVEVKERLGGWCTVGFLGGAKKESIHHGNFKLIETEEGRVIDSSVMVFDYLRAMASMALTGLEFHQAHPDKEGHTKAKLSFLYLGYGAGSLPRFMANTIPGTRHVAVELDEGVVSAAHSLSLDTDPIELQAGDALTYKRPVDNDPFDVVFVDIFDDDNMLPPEFYSTDFLENVIHQNHLGGSPNGMVIHNFHTGGKKRSSQLADAIKSYRSVFSTTFAVESVDSRHTGGNTILLATNKRRLDASSESLSWHIAGLKAQQSYGIEFDIIARTTHKLWLS